MRFVREVALEVSTGGWRTVLSALAVAVSVGTVLVTSATASFASDAFAARDAQLNGRPTTFAVAAAWRMESVDSTFALLKSAEATIQGKGGDYAVLAEAMGSAAAESQIRDCTIVLTTAGLEDVRALPIFAGAWLRDDRAFEIVVNAAAEAGMQGLGGVVRLSMADSGPTWAARVVGVVSDGHPAPRIYVSLPALAAKLPSILAALPPLTLLVRADAPPDLVREAIHAVAREVHPMDGQADPMPVSQLDAIRLELAAQRSAFVAVGIITGSMCALGVFGIALSSIREKGRELAVRRALGTTRFRLFAVSIAAPTIVALFVGLVAVGLTAVTVTIVGPLFLAPGSPQDPPGLDLANIPIALGTAIGVSIVGGAAPAIIAARIDPGLLLRA
jgi:hypothetical protein